MHSDLVHCGQVWPDLVRLISKSLAWLLGQACHPIACFMPFLSGSRTNSISTNLLILLLQVAKHAFHTSTPTLTTLFWTCHSPSHCRRLLSGSAVPTTPTRPHAHPLVHPASPAQMRPAPQTCLQNPAAPAPAAPFPFKLLAGWWARYSCRALHLFPM